MEIITKRTNHVILVDDEDYDMLIAIGGWYIDSRGYAVTDKIIDGRRIVTDMHRLLHPPKHGFIVDHINRNKLDNRKHNLRDATKSINALNSGLWRHNTSGFKGVSWHKHANKWRSTIWLNGKQIHLGFFTAPEEASIAYRSKLSEVLQSE